MTWIEVGQPPNGRLPKWKRSAAVAEDGTIYVPFAIAERGEAPIWCAFHDSIPYVADKAGHVYLPTQWLAREFPDSAEVCRSIEARIAREFAANPEAAPWA